MAEAKPEPPPRPATTTTTGSTRELPPSAAVRYRFPQRPPYRQESSQSPRPPDSARRRSSILSYSSLEDATQSFTDEIINPRTRKAGIGNEENEVTHWHSSPLAFALLPAVGGLFFADGSAFITDVLLLGLAAIFMNWSIRLPWDWYYSAQTVRRDVVPDYSTILEEDEDDEVAVETESSTNSLPKPSEDRKADAGIEGSDTPLDSRKRQEAAADLRRQELWALAATFIFPVLAAYLLHVIRAQLSRPSTGLVSDYNLSIFLLGAEVRPFRQLVRLISNRTLHLQRTATGSDDPFASAGVEKHTLIALSSRLADLEARLIDQTITPSTMAVAQKAELSELSAEMRKRYEPRLEGLERAVRRYEKRTTTLAMLTEQRLQSLETRLQEALSLAAVAARHSQSPGVLMKVLETGSRMITWPMGVAWRVCVWPFVVVEELYGNLKTILLGPTPKAAGNGKRGGAVSRSAGAEEKARAKNAAARKLGR